MKEFLTYDNIRYTLAGICFLAATVLGIYIYIISPIIRKFRKRK